MKLLPACLLRQATERADIYYCRNTKVHMSDDLVTTAVCRNCIWHDTPCNDPRPEDYAARLSQAPSFMDRAFSAGSAAVAFIADGMAMLAEEDVANRLSICDQCEEHQGNWCRRCGCNLTLKARGRAFQCPLGKWPEIDP